MKIDTILLLVGLGVWLVVMFITMWSNHKNEQSNDELMAEIHKSNELNKGLIKEIQKYCSSTSKRATAQDNLLWESIMILARKIHELENSSHDH